jgi:hypothetical protein
MRRPAARRVERAASVVVVLFALLLALVTALDLHALDARGVEAAGTVTGTNYGGRSEFVEVTLLDLPGQPQTTFDPPVPRPVVGDVLEVVVDPSDPSVFRLASTRFDSFQLFVGALLLGSLVWLVRAWRPARPPS